MATMTALAPTPAAPVNPTDVYVDGEKLYGVRAWAYRVWVDGSVYDEFTSTRPLTGRDMMDVASMYRDGLTLPHAA
jgi:hypothetical protein